jgi:hypothetical protein
MSHKFIPKLDFVVDAEYQFFSACVVCGVHNYQVSVKSGKLPQDR